MIDFNPATDMWLFDDFLGNSDSGLIATTSGASASTTGVAVASTATEYGIATMSSGTDTTGRAQRSTAATAYLFGNAIWRSRFKVQIPTLSTAAQEYIAHCGFFDDLAGADATDGAYFYYDRLTDGNFWTLKTASNSSRTKTVTAVAVTAGQWYNMEIFVNAAANLAQFFIDGTLVKAETATIPSGAGRQTGWSFGGVKSAGGTDTNMIACDFVSVFSRMKTPRYAA